MNTILMLFAWLAVSCGIFLLGWRLGQQRLKRRAHPFVSNCSLSAHQKALEILRP
jgi:predicted permease